MNTSIEWTDKTWNPVTGCTKVSEGCRHCYAETIAKRFYPRECAPCGHHIDKHIDSSYPVGHELHEASKRVAECHAEACECEEFKARQFTDVRTHADRLDQPLHWRKPARIFVNSMSDLFHEDVPFEFIDKVFAVMAITRRHTYQILTKRPERMRKYCVLLAKKQAAIRADECPSLHGAFPDVLPNVWLGVSVEDQKTADQRILLLWQTPAAVRFISYEPALGPVDLDGYLPRQIETGPMRWRKGIDWVIVGGESGQGARPFNVQWARSVIEQCKAAGVACFMKQLGKDPYEAPEGITPGTSGPDAVKCRYIELDIDKGHGGDMVEWPEDLRVREFPI